MAKAIGPQKISRAGLAAGGISLSTGIAFPSALISSERFVHGRCFSTCSSDGPRRFRQLHGGGFSSVGYDFFASLLTEWQAQEEEGYLSLRFQ
jgi:hypothetical protein